MDKNISLVAQVVSQLAKLGITAVEKPDDHCAYQGVWGSLANYTKVTIGQIRELYDSLGNPRLGVFVKYEALRESGEDFGDFYVTESRNIPLESLLSYLEDHGIKSRKPARFVVRVYRINR